MTEALKNTIGLIRVRPPELAAEGPDRETLRQMASAALGLNVDDLDLRASFEQSFLLPAAADLRPFDDAVIRELSDFLNDAATAADVVILDLSFTRAQVRFGVIEQIILAAVRNVAPVWSAGARLVLLVERNPRPGDDFAEILTITEMNGATVFVDARGNLLGDAVTGWSDGAAARVAEVARPTPEQLRAAARARSLRRRGVFRVQTSSRLQYSAFKFSTDENALASLLAGYLQAESVGVVVYDHPGAPWLEHAVLSAATTLADHVACFSTDDLFESPEDRTPPDVAPVMRALMEAEDSRACIIVPMVKNGERLAELTAAIRRVGPADIRILAIFLSPPSASGIGLSSPTAGGWAASANIPINGVESDVDFLFDVELHRLRADDWQVRFATFLHEDHDDRSPDWTASRAGLWAMLNEYEASSGYDSTDHGVLMRMNLTDEDAGWLAASAVRAIQQQRGWAREELLIVVPDDATAIRQITLALQRREDVAVATVPRHVLEDPTSTLPDDLVTQLVRFRGLRVVIFDESSATYRTMSELQRVVFDVLEREADLRIVILDLPEHGIQRPEDLISVYGWRPFDRLPRSA